MNIYISSGTDEMFVLHQADSIWNYS